MPFPSAAVLTSFSKIRPAGLVFVCCGRRSLFHDVLLAVAHLIPNLGGDYDDVRNTGMLIITVVFCNIAVIGTAVIIPMMP